MIGEILKLAFAKGRICTATRMQDDSTLIQVNGLDRRLDVFDEGEIVGSFKDDEITEAWSLGAISASESVAWLFSE